MACLTKNLFDQIRSPRHRSIVSRDVKISDVEASIYATLIEVGVLKLRVPRDTLLKSLESHRAVVQRLSLRALFGCASDDMMFSARKHSASCIAQDIEQFRHHREVS